MTYPQLDPEQTSFKSKSKYEHSKDAFHNINSNMSTIMLRFTLIQRQLSRWGRDKMDAKCFADDILSSTFPWLKMFEFRLKFHWSLFQYCNIPTIIWTNDGYFTDAYMRHSASKSYRAKQPYLTRKNQHALAGVVPGLENRDNTIFKLWTPQREIIAYRTTNTVISETILSVHLR